MKKVICITGATDGLGLALVKFFCTEHVVVAISKNAEKLNEIKNTLNVQTYVCDVSDYQQVQSVMRNITSENKRIDVLVNSAGVLSDGELDAVSYEEIKRAIDVNLTGLINTTKAVVSQMKKQKEGSIININSQASLGGGMAEKSIYNASKFGVMGFSKCLQPELAKYGVKVTDIFPGRMQTNMFGKIGLKRDMSTALKLEDVAKTIDYLINLPQDVVIPEIAIKHIKN